MALLDEYAKNLLIQYRKLPKAEATMRLINNIAVCDGFWEQLRDCFTLGNPLCIGNQLTIVGRVVGVNRNVYGLDLSNEFWELGRYDDSIAGTDVNTYAEDDGVGFFERYETSATYTMNDWQLTIMIRLKILQNNFLMSTKNIVDGMYAIFGAGIIVTDSHDMMLAYAVVDAQYAQVITIANYLDILPRPMGVGITI